MRVKNFAKAVVKHAKDGFKKVDVDTYAARLRECASCELQKNGICTHEDCGCILTRKAWWASESCPLKKWCIIEREK
jgi:hypothetical protein